MRTESPLRPTQAGRTRWLVFLLAAVFLFTGGRASPAAEYETAPTFPASKILPKELRVGPEHQVAEKVVNDGWMNRYTIESRFGTFEADSTTLMRIRVSEVYAIAKLAEVSRSEQFAKGVGKAGRDVLSATKSLVVDPVDTVKVAGLGMKEAFSSLNRTVRGESTGGIGETVGYAAAKRRYAEAFGCDPYSTNPVLQAHLTRVSQAGYAGDVGAGVALGYAVGSVGTLASSSVTGVTAAAIASYAVSAAGSLQTVREMVRDMSPDELRELNQGKLEEMGIKPSVIEKYLKNEAFSPTLQTAHVILLEELDGVGGRGVLLDAARRAKSESEARSRVQQSGMYARYHRTIEPLGAFVEVRKRVAVGAKTKGDELLVIAPADYLARTKRVAKKELDARQKAEGARHLWVAGGVSPLATSWLESNGWKVQADASKRLPPKGR